MEYDNTRDRMQYGYDAGQIIDGEIRLDSTTGEYVLVDDDGISFSSQEYFKTMLGKKVRFTCASFESMETMERLMAQAQTKPGDG